MTQSQTQDEGETIPGEPVSPEQSVVLTTYVFITILLMVTRETERATLLPAHIATTYPSMQESVAQAQTTG
eukprot:414602-Hanusia_phi.AAC.5